VFPIGDTPNPKGVAWVNLLLIALNVGIFLLTWPMSQRPADPGDPRYRAYVEAFRQETDAPPDQLALLEQQLSDYDLFVFDHGLRPANPSPLDFLFSMFLHGGFMHLFGNMLFLWIYGDNTEFRLGRPGYLAAYLLTGFAAACGDMLLRPGSNIPAVGASGAISGVLGMYFVWFPHNRVRMLLFLPPFLIRPFELPARIVLLFYIVADNLLPALAPALLGLERRAGGVAYGAHIGGFVAGLLLALLVRLLTRARSGGAEVAAEAGSPSGALAAADGLAASGDARGALGVYDRVLHDRPDRETAIAAHLGAARVLLRGLGQAALAYQHLYSAMQLGPSAEQLEEVRRLMAELRAATRGIPMRMPGGLHFQA
jgi:membrane associated rhomboid family serine protease